MSLAVALWLAFAGAAPQTASDVAAGQLCGVDVKDRAAAIAQLRARPTIKVLQDDGDSIQLVDTANGDIWTFPVSKTMGFPASACGTLGPIGGQIRYGEAVYCSGVPTETCQAFYLMLKGRDAKLIEAMHRQ
jgi:hypothetical protein